MRTDLSLLYSFILSLSAKNAWNVRQRAGTSVTGNDLCAPDGRSPAQPPLLQSAVAVATPCWGPAEKKRIGYKAADMNTTVCSRSCEEGCTASGPAVCSYELPTRCLLCWRLWFQRYGTLASYRPARPGIHVFSAVLQKSNFPIHLTDRQTRGTHLTTVLINWPCFTLTNSVVQEPEVHHRIHNSSPPVHILSQSNPIHPPASLPKIHSDPILPSTPCLPNGLFPPKPCTLFSPLPCVPYDLPTSFAFTWSA
jgi:hypothetical protein